MVSLSFSAASFAVSLSQGVVTPPGMVALVLSAIGLYYGAIDGIEYDVCNYSIYRNRTDPYYNYVYTPPPGATPIGIEGWMNVEPVTTPTPPTPLY